MNDILQQSKFMNATKASLVTMLLAGPVGQFLHNSQLRVFRHEIQGLINGCGATKFSWGISKTGISEAFQAFLFVKFCCSEVYFFSSSMFNSFGIPRMHRAIPFLLYDQDPSPLWRPPDTLCQDDRRPSTYSIFASSGAPPYPFSNKIFTGPFTYAMGLQAPAHLLSPCLENTWWPLRWEEHLCGYSPVALTAGFDSKVEIINSSSDQCTDLFLTAHQDFSWFDTPCR